MNTIDRSIESEISLLSLTLPGIIEVADYFASSPNRDAQVAREALKAREETRPFHVTLCLYASRLDSVLRRILAVQLRNADKSGIRQAVVDVLQILEDSIVVTWSRSTQKPPDYPNLLRWAANYSSPTDKRLSWLLRNSRLATPIDDVRPQLLRKVESCLRIIERHLPIDPAPPDDEIHPMASAGELAAWRSMHELCSGMESVHQQLVTAWNCRCAQPHQDLHFTINPCRPTVSGFLETTIFHDSGGWKQTCTQMKYATGASVPPNYQQFCEDLSTSPVASIWYAITKCNNCTQPMTFQQLCQVINRPLPKQRLCLAVILSHLYLHLSGGAWWPYTRTDTIIRFQGADPTSRLPLNAPLFPFVNGNNMEPELRAQCINPAMPSIVEFGKLLLEIVTWESCSWEENTVQQKLKDLEVRDTDLANSDRILVAILACIGYNGEDRLKARAQEETIRNSEKTRLEFLNVVIRNLERVLRDAYGIDSEAIFSSEFKMHLKPQRFGHISTPNDGHDESLETITSAGRGTQAAPSTRTNTEPNSSVFIYDTQITEMVDSTHRAADAWHLKLQPFKGLLQLGEDTDTTKVAVLDTGFHLHPDIADAYADRIETYCFLANNDNPDRLHADVDGHGTHIASTVLEWGVNCKVYSARICRNRWHVGDERSCDEVAKRVARAIRYAVDVWNVDVISMSFGFQDYCAIIEAAVKHAYDQKVIVFAAAGNNGITEKMRYPARDIHALCVHAATGTGEMYRGNPTEKTNGSNFAFIGVAIDGYKPNSLEKIRRSGTSQATAVAASTAALVLQMMRSGQRSTESISSITPENYDDALSQLKRLDGMQKVFKEMSRRQSYRRDDYEIVQPWNLLDNAKASSPDPYKHLGLFCNSIIGLMNR